MNQSSRKTICAIGVLALALALVIGVSSESAAAQAGNGPKTEDVFKNIQVLTGQPAERLIPTMVFFEASLGVGCTFCHDQDSSRRYRDLKETKRTARKMIQMVMDINKNTFGGYPEVNCFTCHQGRSKPIGMPFVAGTQLPPALGLDYEASLPKPPAVPSLTVDELFDKYLAALGGPNAIQKVPMLIATGRVIQKRPGRDIPPTQLEIYAKAPGKEAVATGTPIRLGFTGQNEQTLAYEGNAGWARAGAGNARDLQKPELDTAKVEDTFNLPRQLKQTLSDLKVVEPERIDHRETYVVTGRTQSLPLVKLYFEKDSGMLTRLVYYTESILGRYPTQIDYSDFRDTNGLKIPYRWVIAQTRNREYIYKIDSVQIAVVDDSKFSKPAALAK